LQPNVLLAFAPSGKFCNFSLGVRIEPGAVYVAVGQSHCCDQKSGARSATLQWL